MGRIGLNCFRDVLLRKPVSSPVLEKDAVSDGKRARSSMDNWVSVGRLERGTSQRGRQALAQHGKTTPQHLQRSVLGADAPPQSAETAGNHQAPLSQFQNGRPVVAGEER